MPNSLAQSCCNRLRVNKSLTAGRSLPGSAAADAPRFGPKGEGDIIGYPLSVDLHQPGRFDSKRGLPESACRTGIMDRGALPILPDDEPGTGRVSMPKLRKDRGIANADRRRPCCSATENSELPEAGLKPCKRVGGTRALRHRRASDGDRGGKRKQCPAMQAVQPSHCQLQQIGTPAADFRGFIPISRNEQPLAEKSE